MSNKKWLDPEDKKAYKRAYSTAYYEAHTAERIAYARKRYRDDPERAKKAVREYVLANPDVKRRIQAKYRAANLDKLNAYWHKRRAMLKGNGGSHTAEQWAEKLEAFDNRCAYCATQGKMTKDHILAVANGGTDDIDNLVPACLSCNSRKGKRNVALLEQKVF